MRRPAVDPLAPLAGADGTGPGAPPPSVAAPEIQRLGDEITLNWCAHGVTVDFGSLRESGDGIHGEVSVVSEGHGEVHWGRLNVASTSAREGLVRKLDVAAPGPPWRPILERACRLAADQLRQGEPITTLHPLAPGMGSRYLVEKVLPLGETAVVFGDGGAGKGFLAGALAVAVSTSTPLPGGLHPSQRTRVLYLDWESCQEEQEERLHALCNGLEVAAPEILYRPMARALADDAPRLRAEIARRQVGLVIVDSFGPACGAEPEGADAAIRTMNALRSFAPATRLVLAHVSKASAELRQGPARPYGSVYVQNLARSCWEVRRSGEDDSDLVMALYHRKTNRGRLHAPIGLRFAFVGDVVKIQPCDLGQQPDLLARTGLTYRIGKVLATSAQSVKKIAEALAENEDSVRRTLSRLEDEGKVIRLPEKVDGLIVWRLASARV